MLQVSPTMNMDSSPSIYLNRFFQVKPVNKLSQQLLVEWTANCHQQAERLNPATVVDQKGLSTLKKLFERYAVKENQILQRYFECHDVFKPSLAESEIYLVNEHVQSGVDILARTQFFAKRAKEVFKQVYLSENKPDHLIHVTCTGYISPSAAQVLVADPQWNKTTAVTHAYHMGCYAALPAIRIASAVVHQNNHLVDIVHTEMCGLHMNPLAQTPEQTIVQTLFADGHMKYSVSQEKAPQGKNLRVVAIHEKVLPDSGQDMSWTPAAWGMQMNLSREVPTKIKGELKSFFNELLNKCAISYTDAMKSVFAIHPGGPKIIDSVQEVLELSDEQTKHSKKILFERGNMSSATLPHVWEEILNDNPAGGTKVISFAFGPGLTLFGSVFEVC